MRDGDGNLSPAVFPFFDPWADESGGLVIVAARSGVLPREAATFRVPSEAGTGDAAAVPVPAFLAAVAEPGGE